MEKRDAESHNNTILIFALLIVSLLFLYFTPSMLPSLGPGAITGYVASQVGNFTGTVSTTVSCVWSTPALSVSFGTSLTPGNNDTNATQNYLGGVPVGATYYNVSVDALSNTNANITIRGEDFISGANKIAIANVTWISNVSVANSTDMSPANSRLLTGSFNTTNPVGFNIAQPNTVWFRFFMDVPPGAIAGAYTGNYTMQCVAAT